MRILILTLLLSLSALAQGQSQTYDLAPPTINTQPQSKGYQWVARGEVYPAGTFPVRPESDSCTVPSGVQAIGRYAIFGRFGGPEEHIATYRLTFGKTSYFFDGYVRTATEEENGGMPLSFLFGVVGSVPARLPDLGSAEYTPRGTSCFGGQVKIFLKAKEQ